MSITGNTPGERLQAVFKEIHVSRKEVSKSLGISLSSLSVYYNDHQKIRRMMALAIQARYAINAEWLLYNKKPIFITSKSNALLEDTTAIVNIYTPLSQKSKGIVKTVIQALLVLEKQTQ